MLVEFGKAGWIDKARQQPDKVRMVLDKIKTDGLQPTIEAVFNKLDQPLPLGYCNVGRVAEVGAGVTGFETGERVISNGKHAEVVSVPINLCAKVPDNVPDEDAAFTVLGALRQRAQDEGLDNVIFVDSVPKDEVVRYWSLLDASIIHLKKDELFTTVIPSKLFECMGMAIPVLHGVQGESAGIVEREDVGLLFEPENADALIQGLRRLADDQPLYQRLKTNGPLAANRYDRTALAEKMLKVLEGLDVQKRAA